MRRAIRPSLRAIGTTYLAVNSSNVSSWSPERMRLDEEKAQTAGLKMTACCAVRAGVHLAAGLA